MNTLPSSETVHSLVDEYSNTIVDLQADVLSLEQQLKYCQAENVKKDKLIASLQARLSNGHDLKQRGCNLQQQPNTYMRTRTNETDEETPIIPTAIDTEKMNLSLNSDTCSVHSYATCEKTTRDIVDKIQQWLFLEGGNLRDVESLISEYCNFCRSVGIPLDRIFIAGMMLHPQMSAYVWKWEVDQEFQEHEVPHTAFEKPNFNPDEPFAVLLEGRAINYRMTAGSEYIPPGCAWFTRDGYQDYYALPIYHRGEMKGAMAWSTRDMRGWNAKHLQIFERSLAALSTVLRLHTNDIVTKTLTVRLEQHVQSQTRELEMVNENLAKANDNLGKANAKIIQQSEAQLRHFAMMSHEIRTPLNCVIGLSNLLLMEEELPSEMKESVEMITSSGDLLLAVVNDVLDYAKLAAGKVETNMRVCDLQTTINAVAYVIKSKAQTAGVHLQTNITAPTRIYTDSRRLQQILYNLLGNAIKFGKQGKQVDFTVSSTADSVIFSIKDYGLGIAPKDMKKIFEPFQQSSNNDPRTHGGTGLGLAITHQLVQVLGGTISVQSEFGHWCDFQVHLPLDLGDSNDDDDNESCGFGLDRSGHVSINDEIEDLHDSQMTTHGFDVSQPTAVTMTTGMDDETSQTSSSDQVVEEEQSQSRNKKIISAGPLTYVASPSCQIPKSIGLSTYAASFLCQIPKIINIAEDSPVEEERASSNEMETKVGTVEKLTRATTPDTTKTSLGGLRVLIAEDNIINQKVLLRTLNRIGVQHVDLVENGKLAVETSEKLRYDVIFMDLQMPVMDGLEATSIITQRQERPKIIFLTAHALKDYQDQAIAAGGDGFVSKPFKIGLIQECLEQCVNTRTATGGPSQKSKTMSYVQKANITE